MTTVTRFPPRLKWRLVAMTDTARGGDPLQQAGSLPAGAWLIFRHYDHPNRADLALRLVRVCRARRVTLLVAGDPRLAHRLRAGLHLPDRPVLRSERGPARPLSMAAHDRHGLVRAKKFQADSVLLSPLFATDTHPGARPLGLLRFRSLVRQARLPVIALGGLTRTRVRGLRRERLSGVASVGALFR